MGKKVAAETSSERKSMAAVFTFGTVLIERKYPSGVRAGAVRKN